MHLKLLATESESVAPVVVIETAYGGVAGVLRRDIHYYVAFGAIVMVSRRRPGASGDLQPLQRGIIAAHVVYVRMRSRHKLGDPRNGRGRGHCQIGAAIAAQLVQIAARTKLRRETLDNRHYIRR